MIIFFHGRLYPINEDDLIASIALAVAFVFFAVRHGEQTFSGVRRRFSRKPRNRAQ